MHFTAYRRTFARYTVKGEPRRQFDRRAVLLTRRGGQDMKESFGPAQGPEERIVIYNTEVKLMGKLTGKKLIFMGERDGVPSPAMEAVFAGSGAEVAFAATECFV